MSNSSSNHGIGVGNDANDSSFVSGNNSHVTSFLNKSSNRFVLFENLNLSWPGRKKEKTLSSAAHEKEIDQTSNRQSSASTSASLFGNFQEQQSTLRKYRDPQGLFVLSLPKGFYAQPEHNGSDGSVVFVSSEQRFQGLILASSAEPFHVSSTAQWKQIIPSHCLEVTTRVLSFSVTKASQILAHDAVTRRQYFEGVSSSGEDLEGIILFAMDDHSFSPTFYILSMISIGQPFSIYDKYANHIVSNSKIYARPGFKLIPI